MRLPPLNALRAFEAATRLGSYVAAAQALHVTQPAIGRHVKLLEDWLGVALLERTPRGVVPTRAGQQYYAAVAAALQQIADASLAIRAPEQERWLRLRVVPGFASRWLAPRLPDLRALRPDLRIAIEPHATFTALDPQRADIGICFGDPQEFAGRRITLARPPVFPVSAPSYLTQAPPLHSAADLLQHALVHEDDGWWWNHWLAAQGLSFAVRAELSYVSFDHAIDQALAGRGIALANALLVEELLTQGRLVRPIREASVLQGYQLLLPDGALSADAVWFCDWLRRTLGEISPGG